MTPAGIKPDHDIGETGIAEGLISLLDTGAVITDRILGTGHEVDRSLFVHLPDVFLTGQELQPAHHVPVKTGLADESAEFKKSLQKHLKSGIPFPNARSRALIDCCPGMSGITELTSSPNNILAIEYLKSLIRYRSTIKPVTIKRFGAGYNDPYVPGQAGISAKAIREAVSYGSYNDSMSEYIPEDSFNSIKEAIEKKQVLTEDDFSEMIIYKLISERQQGYTKYLDVSDDLSDRIVNNLERKGIGREDY